MAAAQYVCGDGAWCWVGTKSHVRDCSGRTSSAGPLLGHTVRAGRVGGPAPSPEITALGVSLRGPSALRPVTRGPSWPGQGRRLCEHPRRGPQDAPTDVLLVRGGREGERPRAPEGGVHQPWRWEAVGEAQAAPWSIGSQGGGLTPEGGEMADSLQAWSWAAVAPGPGDFRRAASCEGSSALLFVAGGAGTGPSLRLRAALSSLEHSSLGRARGHSPRLSPRQQTALCQAPRGGDLRVCPPVCVGGGHTPVDTKSPSGQDGARLEEEPGCAELNQSGLHHPHHLQPCRAAGVSPGSPSAQSHHSATGWAPTEASPSRCLLCPLQCSGHRTATRGAEAWPHRPCLGASLLQLTEGGGQAGRLPAPIAAPHAHWPQLSFL